MLLVDTHCAVGGHTLCCWWTHTVRLVDTHCAVGGHTVLGAELAHIGMQKSCADSCWQRCVYATKGWMNLSNTRVF